MTNHSACHLLCLSLISAPLLFGALGCGDDSRIGKTFPVEGRLTVNQEPLTEKTTVVLFKPDVSKGNMSTFEPVGTVDENGVYKVQTEGKKGAPLGWYKVVVTATASTPVHPSSLQNHRPVAQSLLPAKYGQEQTTDLAVEVVENPDPGAYDLKLTK